MPNVHYYRQLFFSPLGIRAIYFANVFNDFSETNLAYLMIYWTNFYIFFIKW